MVLEVGAEGVGAVGQDTDGQLPAYYGEEADHVGVGFAAVGAPGAEGLADVWPRRR
ncbi:hypothetical protein GCM10023220_01070 [Streptomyces ziwulingensis]|uniref:Uncharacterized protein n=1 Tax=Streptomyces ziwulingensis TaxID=1045501 RepID=A0ABP9AJB1_9ACTN